MRAILIGVLMTWAIAAPVPATSEVLRFRAVLTGAGESPAAPTRGAGLAEVTLDTESRLLSWKVTYSGLSGPVIGAHFKAPPEPGSAGGATMTFVAPVASPLVSSIRLNDIQVGDLRAGLWSIALLTARNPRGEIGGALERAARAAAAPAPPPVSIARRTRRSALHRE